MGSVHPLVVDFIQPIRPVADGFAGVEQVGVGGWLCGVEGLPADRRVHNVGGQVVGDFLQDAQLVGGCDGGVFFQFDLKPEGSGHVVLSILGDLGLAFPELSQTPGTHGLVTWPANGLPVWASGAGCSLA